ncbi:MAG TPA: hypothetical protein VH369_22080 [Bryobacteraceae bacterium]|jgi:hypothetical protein
MKSFMTLGLACGFICSGQNLTIRLYNLANVPAKTMDQASAVAGQMLAQAGVAVTWEAGSPDNLEGRLTDMSTSPTTTDTRNYLVASVVKDTPATFAPGALGYSLPLASQGAHAIVFYDRVEKLSLGSRVGPGLRVGPVTGTLLGAAIAHEIGHVLLGSTEHSAQGIMKARWGLKEFQELACKDLRFASTDATRLQAGVSSRFGNRLQVSNYRQVAR